MEYAPRVCTDGMYRCPSKLECHVARNDVEAIGEHITYTQHFGVLALISGFTQLIFKQ